MSRPYNKQRDIRIGLEIFERHGGRDCEARHDELSAGPADSDSLTDDDRSQLDAAGWTYVEEYDSWTIFT